jgi:hypothetical protein
MKFIVAAAAIFSMSFVGFAQAEQSNTLVGQAQKGNAICPVLIDKNCARFDFVSDNLQDAVVQGLSARGRLLFIGQWQAPAGDRPPMFLISSVGNPTE